MPLLTASLRAAARIGSLTTTILLIVFLLMASGTMPTGWLLELASGGLPTGSRVDGRGTAFALTEDGLLLRAERLDLEGIAGARAERASLLVPLGSTLRRDFRLTALSADRLWADIDRPPPSDDEAPLDVSALLDLLADEKLGTVSLPSFLVSYPVFSGEGKRTVEGSLSARSAAQGYLVESAAYFPLTEDVRTEAKLRALSSPEGGAAVTFRSDGAPLQPLLTLLGVDAVELQGNLLGELALEVDRDGQPLAGDIDLTVEPGLGRLGETAFGFGENRVRAHFREGAPSFNIEELRYEIDGNRGLLTGLVRLENLLHPNEMKVMFDVTASDVVLDLKSVLPAPLDVGEARAAGLFDAQERRIAFSDLHADYFGTRLTGKLALTFPEGFDQSPRLEAEATIPGPLTPQEVLAGWPYNLAFGARGWVEANLTAGRLTNLRYEADIPMNAIRPLTPLSNDVMRFTFDASDGVVRYLPGMPVLKNLEATALVRGNSFRVDAEKGSVLKVGISDGSFVIPQFFPGGATARFDATLTGRLDNLLSAVEEAGFVDFTEAVYQPEAFRGRGDFDLSVSWPLKDIIAEDEIVFGGEGAFVRGSLDDVLPGIDATDAGGRVLLSNKELVVRGDGLAASAPATFEWRQSLLNPAQAELAVTAEVDNLAADMVGVPLRQFFRGEVTTDVLAKDLSPGAPFAITADLTDAAVSLPAFGLLKQRGTGGLFETLVRLPREGVDEANIIFDGIKLTSPTFNIEGTGTFTPEGGVVRLELPRFFIEDRADLSVQLVPKDYRLNVDISGEHADAGPLIVSILENQGAGSEEQSLILPGRADLDMDLSRVSLREGISLRKFAAQGRHTGKAVEQLTISALIGDAASSSEGYMSVAIDQPEGQELGFVEIEATDFGRILQGVFGITSISGAGGSLKGTTKEGEGFEGRFEMGELLITEAPLLARILSFTSLDGLADALNGEGIRFTQLEGDVALDEGVMTFENAKLVGSSLGISAGGTIDLDTGRIDMRGAFAPAYAVNSLLGSIPGLGRLFVSRDGEGIVAFSYQISGTTERPIVTVNALSALTPGILRRIFDPVKLEPTGAAADLSEAP
ncbi:YhdP family protein [Parvularcula maris]|uniref:DUF3971 domain-containing protein n=1 Tax=Parvularcula maris TaxID=2965077 RepID=A0A9X2RKL5_9PROT|nr:AsmA-like C-terminal domain-containing protein [Parvularcula maris]MCQ8185717.1 DUF3971 domain-containing protein [Parvularcula maris]